MIDDGARVRGVGVVGGEVTEHDGASAQRCMSRYMTHREAETTASCSWHGL